MDINLENLLLRGQMALEDGDFVSADRFYDAALNQDPRCGGAWWGKFLAQYRCRSGKEYVSQRLTQLAAASGTPARVQFSQSKALIPGYFEGVSFDGGYHAMAPVRQAQLDQEKQFWASGTVARMLEFSGDQSEPAEVKEQILAELSNRLQAALAEDATTCQRLQEQYTALEKAQHEQAVQNRARDYAFCREAAKSGKLTDLKKAQTLLTAMGSYEDSAALLKETRERISSIQKKQRRRAILAVSAVALVAALILLTVTVIIPSVQYSNAETLLEEGKYDEAKAEFAALDEPDMVKKCDYAYADSLVEAGKYLEAAKAFQALGNYSDAQKRAFALWDQIAVRETIGAGIGHTVGLKADGTVVAVGANGRGQCDVSGWSDVIAISAGGYHTVGLKGDGTVLAKGWNEYGQCDVSEWTDIVAISAGVRHTVALKADGTVVAVGDNEDGQRDVSGWSDVVAISAGYYHTVGLKKDGTVVAVGDNEDGQCDVSGWSDVVAISAGFTYTVGIKADGTVVAVGNNAAGQCDVYGWTDIVAISAGYYHTVGIKSDGTVVAVGANWNSQCTVFQLRDVVAISAGMEHTVGLEADGTIVAVGDNRNGQCNVSDWKDIKLPNS